MPTRHDPVERFFAKVNKAGPISAARPDLGPCWLWTAGGNDGYGAFFVEARPGRSHLMKPAHTWLYERLFGPLPAHLHPDHLCRVRKCVNPTHLEPVDTWTNLRRSPLVLSTQNEMKTHCIRGHDFSASNTAIVARSNGRTYRRCRLCARDQMRILRSQRNHHPLTAPQLPR